MDALHPAEGDGSFFVALAEAEQKCPVGFFLQKLHCPPPAHEPHDQAATHKQFQKL